MPEALKVGIVGRHGRLGSAAATWVREDPELDLVGAVGPSDDWTALEGAIVCLEVTRAGLGAVHAKRALDLGMRPLVGTSGVSHLEVDELDEHARSLGLGGAVIPNFSIGFLALCRAAAVAQRDLQAASIVEAHRPQKADAPSASALHLANRAGVPARSVASVRVPGVTAIHELRMIADAESLVLRHESQGLESFRGGLLASLRFAAAVDGVAYGLDEVMGELAL